MLGVEPELEDNVLTLSLLLDFGEPIVIGRVTSILVVIFE